MNRHSGNQSQPAPWWHNLGLMVVAAGIAAVAFHGHWPKSYALLALIPVLWAKTSTRLHGGWVLAVYGAVLSLGLPVSAEVFYGTATAFWGGLGVWCFGVLLYFSMGVIFWSRKRFTRILCIPLLILLWTSPPFGLIGWGNPLLAAGWLFPHWGWWGLLALVVIIMLVAYRFAFIALPLFCFVITQNITVSGPPGWVGHDTTYAFGVAQDTRDLLVEFNRHREMSERLNDSRHAVHLYPETVGGVWNTMAGLHWQAQLKRSGDNKIALIGTSSKTGRRLYNSVVQVTAEQSRVVYRQRVPLPGVMWNPLARDSYSMAWDSNPVTNIQGTRTAFLLCYESLLALPVLHSLWHQPDHLASLSSIWWAPEYIRQAQHSANLSWARLFELTLSEAYNDGH